MGQRLAIIPARGGSKRIPRKNVRVMAGIPLIGRTIETAKQSELFDRIVVSTDDDEIAEISRQFGAETPFRRPAELADDFCPTRPVISHALNMLLAESSEPFDLTCVLYPAAVLIEPDDLIAALKVLRLGQCDQVFSAARFPAPIQRAWSLDESGFAIFREPEMFNSRSQDLLETFFDAGQFYWSRNEYWLGNRAEETYRRKIYELPRHKVCDIDTEEDWKFAELLIAVNRIMTQNKSS
jgi:N-acylneuraminate cytidylyltransferase